MEYEVLSDEDRGVVERQLGRPLRGTVMLASRCPHRVAQVIVTMPLLENGTPFPTLYWLTCPLLRKEVSRLESGEYRHTLRRKIKENGAFAATLSLAESRYVAERERLAEKEGKLEEVREYLSGRDGIGGTVAGGLKCLHAHLAHYLAGGNNPVGAEVAQRLLGLQDGDCPGDCRFFLDKEKKEAGIEGSGD